MRRKGPALSSHHDSCWTLYSLVSCPSPQSGAELGPSRALSLCLAENGGGGSGTGEQCLKPNCVLSNPSAEDSSPSPSRLADKCRSRPPVCQGCLNWYQDVPGLHRPGHCLLLPAYSCCSPWPVSGCPPPSLGGAAVPLAPRGGGAQQDLSAQGNGRRAALSLKKAIQCAWPRKMWGDAEEYRQTWMHFHGNNMEG